MKKAFTLVELLIVILVLVTLMSIVFRLSSIGADTTKRSYTIKRLQRLENALSGYYAAFGSYPAVRLHNSRNYKLSVSARHHVQSKSYERSDLNWDSVREACRAQPVGCEFPFPNNSTWSTYVESISDQMAEQAQEWQDNSDLKEVFIRGFTSDLGGTLNKYTKLDEWRDVQLFKFGLMSFLLPRYLFMMDGEQSLYLHAQWKSNNTLPCDPMTGKAFGSWDKIQEYVHSESASDLARVQNIPSQAVCARWMPALAGVCSTSKSMKFFGITVSWDADGESADLKLDTNTLDVHSPGGYDSEAVSGQYLLDFVEVVDGWKNDLYYYSPAPYQSYVLWSGGPNTFTFPPWVDRNSLTPADRAKVEGWTADDIMCMSK